MFERLRGLFKKKDVHEKVVVIHNYDEFLKVFGNPKLNEDTEVLIKAFFKKQEAQTKIDMDKDCDKDG